MIRYILDTDHLSLAQRRHPQVIARILSTPKDEIAITIITVEEQIRGRFAEIRRHQSGKDCVIAYQQLRQTLDNLLGVSILDFDPAAELIDQMLKSQKLKIGTQDRRIAAIALANNCQVITRNISDFGQIPGLQIENWV
jgi:tRNA(fMet)-specific endonuclease VapC